MGLEQTWPRPSPNKHSVFVRLHRAIYGTAPHLAAVERARGKPALHSPPVVVDVACDSVHRNIPSNDLGLRGAAKRGIVSYEL